MRTPRAARVNAAAVAGISQVRFGTVFVVVPAVVQSHPASVSQAPPPSLAGARESAIMRVIRPSIALSCR